MKSETILVKFEYFSDIINRKINISEWALNNNTSKQNASSRLKTFLNNVYTSDMFTNFEKNILEQDGNYVTKINASNDNKYVVDVFSYKYKNNIFEINGDIFYSNIEKNNLSVIISETLNDMGVLDIEKALISNNIDANEDFIKCYNEKSVFSDFKIRPLAIMEGILKEHGKPMSKEELLSLSTSYGIKYQTARNIIRNPTNNMNKIVNLGSTACDKDVFFESYTSEEYRSKLILAAIAVCEKNDICTTDIKWIVSQINLNYPDIDTNRYTLLELKAIICSEEQFQQGIKHNISYLDKQCQFAPENLTELLESILEEYVMPIGISYIVKKIEERGKICSQSTLSSITMPNNPIFTRIDRAGWFLTKYNDLVTKTFKEANELSKADFWNQIKKQLGVVTISDMAKKLDMNINTVYISYYKGESYEPFITKMNEHGWTFSIKDAQIKLIRR